jgi:hypothetical protein
VTPADIIVEVRRITQDTLAPYRLSDAELLGFVNLTLKRTSILRPDLFAEFSDIATTANSVIQTLPTGAIRLLDIFYVKDGDAISEVDRESLSRSYPGWASEAAGIPMNYMRHVKNGEQYFLYPKPTAGVVLVGEYANSPPDYTINETITNPPSGYMPVLVDGVVFLAESLDAEHVTSGRAKLFLDSFTQSLGASLQSRTVTDTKAAGLKPPRAVGGSGSGPLGEVI